MTAMLTPHVIVSELVEQQAMINCGTGLEEKAPLFGTENANSNCDGIGRTMKSGNRDRSDKNQDRNGKPTCFITI